MTLKFCRGLSLQIYYVPRNSTSLEGWNTSTELKTLINCKFMISEVTVPCRISRWFWLANSYCNQRQTEGATNILSKKVNFCGTPYIPQSAYLILYLNHVIVSWGVSCRTCLILLMSKIRHLYQNSELQDITGSRRWADLWRVIGWWPITVKPIVGDFLPCNLYPWALEVLTSD